MILKMRGHKQMRAALAKLRTRLPVEYGRLLERTTFKAADRIKQHYRTSVHVRSGLLIRSVQTHLIRLGDHTESATVSTTTTYALTHEQGATIRPKGIPRMLIVGRRKDGTIVHKMGGGKMLAIPLTKTEAGASRERLIDIAAMGLAQGRPFRTFVSRSGRALMLATGRVVRPIAALAKQVRIPARPIWKPTARWASGELLKGSVNAFKRAA